MFKTNNWLKNLIILLWLNFNFVSWAADVRTELIKNDRGLAAVIADYNYKRLGGEKVKCIFADCLQNLDFKGAKLHMLACHATDELKKAHSLCCDKCDYKTLQKTNLNSHKMTKHYLAPKELGLKRLPRGIKRRAAEISVASESASASKPDTISTCRGVVEVVRVSFFPLDDSAKAGDKVTIKW